MSPFLEYLTSLAVEGETLLAVEQKPIKKNGEFQYHNDGALKCVWPASLPDKVKPGGAWYINTGCFIVDRFIDGKPVAAAANIDFCAFLVLDDIGTKSKVPPLPPTWVIETSPGNYQWGYVYKEQPTKGEQAAALVAIAEAGYTDPGAINPVRNVRLPGSINIKPGRDNFESQLVEFHSDREYTLVEICAALGVTPAQADTATQRSIALLDNGNDEVLKWLGGNGMVLARPNGSGWVGVTCPNAAEHTDGNPEGRYHPVHRSYCCLHSHCHEWTSERFLDWVEDQGGPSCESGLRGDLLASVMAPALTRLMATQGKSNRFSEATDADVILKQAEEKQLSRLERGKWFGRYAYNEANDGYFDLVTRVEISRGAFNARYRHVHCLSMHGGRRIEASIWFDENRHAGGGLTLAGLTYAPGETALCHRNGEVFGNHWLNCRAYPDPNSDLTNSELMAKPWLDHAKTLIPDDDERNHALDMLAYKMQNPSKKINHAFLLHGDPGCGKDLFFKPFIRAVGGEFERNVVKVDKHQIDSAFGYRFESEIFVIEELRPDDYKDRRGIENTLKTVIAAPPDFLEVNTKGKAPYKAVNRILVLAMSNHRDAIALTDDDRRWFCVWTNAPLMNPVAAERYVAWCESGGYAAVASYLMTRDVSAFMPGKAPMMNEAKALMIEQARSPAEEYCILAVRSRSGDFERGFIAAPLFKIMDRLQVHAPQGVKVTQTALYHAMKVCGWLDLGRVHSIKNKGLKRMFCAPGMADIYSRSDIRDMVEEEETVKPKVSLVK